MYYYNNATRHTILPYIDYDYGWGEEAEAFEKKQFNWTKWKSRWNITETIAVQSERRYANRNME